MAYIGSFAPGSDAAAVELDTKLATKYTSPSTGFTATWIAVSLFDSIGLAEARFAIYSDNGGSPDALLGETAVLTKLPQSSDVLETAPLDSPVTIAASTDYWLVVQSNIASFLGYRLADNAGGSSELADDTFSDGLEDPFGSSSSGTIQLAIVAGDGIGPGDMAANGGVFEASDGTKLAVLSWQGGVYLYSDVDGNSLVLEDFYVASELHTSIGVSVFVDAAIDSSDNIHLVSAGDGAGSEDFVYWIATESAGSWSFGTVEEVAHYTQADPANPGCAISIDSNDDPHVLFVDFVKQGGTNRDNVYYTEKTGASWATPTQIGFRDTKTDGYDQPAITLRNSDYVEAIYRFGIAGDLAYRTYTTSWSGESVYSDTVSHTGGVTSTTGGTVYRTHTGNTKSVRENGVDTLYDQRYDYSTPSAALNADGDRFIFYRDDGDDVHLISNDGGGWTDEGDLQVGTYTGVIAGWSYNNLNNTTSIDYIYTDGTNIYYGEYSLTTPASTPPRLRPLRIWPRRM